MNLHIDIDWTDLIYRGIESEELDYKAAQNWQQLSRAGKAKFARHCLALANTKGGYIVVGVGEDESGKPALYTGLSPAEAKSFDPTTVGNFVNKYAEPQINFTVERPRVGGKQYVVFVVKRFDDLPHVCAQGCEHELQQGVFYIRTADASSRPAYRASEIHQIVRRALRNQRELLGRMIRGILYEDRKFQSDDNRNHFKEQLHHSRALLQRKRPPAPNRPVLEIIVTPDHYIAERFSLSELKQACRNSLRLGSKKGSFISISDMEQLYAANISLRYLPPEEHKSWQLFQSGMFHYRLQLDTPPKTIHYAELVRLIAEAMLFFGQFYEELEFADEILKLTFILDNVEDTLLDQAPAGALSKLTTYRCHIPRIKYSMQRTSADLVSGNIDHSVRVIQELCERFNMPVARHRNLINLLKTIS